MTLLYLLFFCINVLFSPSVGRSTFPYFTESKTEIQYKGFKTLWKPYTQLFTHLNFYRNSEVANSTTPRTTFITMDENLRTPDFLNDYYYEDQPRGTVKKHLVLRENVVNADIKKHEYTQRYRIVQVETPRGGFPPLFKDAENDTTRTSTTTTMEHGAGGVPNVGAYCYVCGLDETGIQYPKCYDAFDSSELIFSNVRTMKDSRKHCMQGSGNNNGKSKKWYGKLYRGGCFKRFTDVGYVYNERGCRTQKPFMGSTFASKRFAKLERLLKGVDNGCVFSPHAELTPFSRAVSLYVRYHVCVCKGKYCNRATCLTCIHIHLITVVWIVRLFWL